MGLSVVSHAACERRRYEDGYVLAQNRTGVR